MRKVFFQYPKVMIYDQTAFDELENEMLRTHAWTIDEFRQHKRRYHKGDKPRTDQPAKPETP